MALPTVDKQAILRQIREAGVIGAGGAGFPTYKKLETQVEFLIANGAECEPLLQKDRETLRQDRAAFLRGLEIAQQITGALRVTVAVKEKNQDLVESYRPDFQSRGYHPLIYRDVYPAGDEYVLVYEVTGRLIPPGGIPLQVGCVTSNVETIANLARAVDGQPVVDKCLTICGAVQRPLTTLVPVGTSLADCLERAGGCTVDDPLLLTGGLMMGGVTTEFSDPVTKTMGGLIALPREHYLAQRKSQSRETYTRIGHGQCDQCALCTELCPRYIMGYPIEPHKVMRTLLMTGQARQRGSVWAQYCCECNVCSYIACPEQLDPKNICVDAKRILRQNGLGRTESELAMLLGEPHPARRGREIPIATLMTRLGLRPYAQPMDFASGNGWWPKRVTIPLDSHVGVPAVPRVRRGDRVQRGDLIATVEPDQLGCPAHASIDGRVTAVAPNHIQITA